jgi:hypothetical protein
MANYVPWKRFHRLTKGEPETQRRVLNLHIVLDEGCI